MPPIRPYAVAPDRLPAYVEALAAMLEGDGPALLPYADGDPEPAVPDDADLPDDLGLVVSTSGSTGAPKRAMLTRAALRASGTATHDRLGGEGMWLLALPAQHIAGTQVILRSLAARRAPLLLNMIDGFRTADLVDALAWAPPVRRYTSLVPTQLATVLDDPEATEALGTFDGVLVGGAATAPALLERARAAGVAVRTTYGMSETAGGCVYDGVPLEDTAVTIGDDGRVGLSGPTVASGYLGESDRTAAVFDTDPATGARRFWTDDVGELRDGVLHVVGRRDDLITTGGLKVAPRLVEEAALGLPGVRDAVAVATPHERWGQAVSLAVVASPEPTLEEVRAGLRELLPAYALPTRLLVLDAIPARGPGKPDRAAIAAMPGWQNQG